MRSMPVRKGTMVNSPRTKQAREDKVEELHGLPGEENPSLPAGVIKHGWEIHERNERWKMKGKDYSEQYVRNGKTNERHVKKK